MLSAGIQKLPITWLSVDNFDNRVLCYKPTSINHNIHGCFLCRYRATGWFWWISGLRAVTMWSSSSFTKRRRISVASDCAHVSVLGPFLFLLFINDISNFPTDGRVANLFADDVMICASGDSVNEVKLNLQNCLDNISAWYRENRLRINSDKSRSMLVGMKAQLKSLNVDEFISNYEGAPLELVENAKYLGMSINPDISWDSHVQRLCQNVFYHLSSLRRLRSIFPRDILLQLYKTYIQPRLDYGITLYGCSAQKDIDLRRYRAHYDVIVMYWII